MFVSEPLGYQAFSSSFKRAYRDGQAGKGSDKPSLSDRLASSVKNVEISPKSLSHMPDLPEGVQLVAHDLGELYQVLSSREVDSFTESEWKSVEDRLSKHSEQLHELSLRNGNPAYQAAADWLRAIAVRIDQLSQGNTEAISGSIEALEGAEDPLGELVPTVTASGRSSARSGIAQDRIRELSAGMRGGRSRAALQGVMERLTRLAERFNLGARRGGEETEEPSVALSGESVLAMRRGLVGVMDLLTHSVLYDISWNKPSGEGAAVSADLKGKSPGHSILEELNDAQGVVKFLVSEDDPGRLIQVVNHDRLLEGVERIAFREIEHDEELSELTLDRRGLAGEKYLAFEDDMGHGLEDKVEQRKAEAEPAPLTEQEQTPEGD